MNNAERLFRQGTNADQVDSYKYKLSCENSIKRSLDTTTWIELMKQIEHDSGDYKLFLALLQKSTSIVVKVGDSEKLSLEYRIGKHLHDHNVSNFINYFCHFSCLNYLKNVNVNKSLCSEHGNKIGIIVMPYYDLGRIDKYKWTRKNFDILKSVLVHIVFSLFDAYKACKFVHRDCHLGNILLTETKTPSLQYSNGHTLKVHGILPIIMDFDRSVLIEKQASGIKQVYLDIRRIFLLISSELDVKTNITEIGLPVIDNLIINETHIDDSTYEIFKNIIENLSIKFVMSELKLPW